MSDDSKKVKKIIPSVVERKFQEFLYKTIGEKLPENMTPNQMTLIGALGGLFAVICIFLTHFSKWFFIGMILGSLTHLVADDLDGFIARKRNMGSESGAYFDLLTDILFSTFLVIALGFSPYANIYIMIFMVPLYAIINITCLYNILYYNEFILPRLGPIEAHICFMIVAIGSMIFGAEPLFYLLGTAIHFADIIILVGGVAMYYEMIRMQVSLFRRLKKDGR